MSNAQHPIGFLTLPPEVRNMIYARFCLGPLQLNISRRKTFTMPPYRLYIATASLDNESRQQLVALRQILKLASTCRTVQAEVFRLVYPEVTFSFDVWETAEHFNGRLSATSRKAVSRLEFQIHPTDRKSDVDVRHAWLGVLDGYDNIQQVQIHHVVQDRDEAWKGTKWNESSLRYLKAIMADHPAMTVAYEIAGPYNQYPTVSLQSASVPPPNSIGQFSPEDEYKNYLAKLRTMKARRKQKKETADEEDRGPKIVNDTVDEATDAVDSARPRPLLDSLVRMASFGRV